MKRRRVIFIGALALLGVLLALLVWMSPPDPANAPRFVRMDKQPAGAFQWQEYDWGGAVPFQGGKMWVMTTLGTNHPYLLYDLEKRRVEGEMLNGSAIF